MKRTVFVLIVLLAVLHQDFWWWNDVEPLVFGFLPVGLAYHAGISIAAAFLWWLAVRYCWPAHLEAWAEQSDPARSGGPDA